MSGVLGILRFPGFSPILLFELGVYAIYIWLLWLNWKKSEFAYYRLLLFGMLAFRLLYNFIAESIGVSSGGYFYSADFWIRIPEIPLPWVIPNATGPAACQPDNGVAFAITVAEVSIAYAALRTSNKLIQREHSPARLARAAMDAFIALTFILMLDPLVSTAGYCAEIAGVQEYVPAWQGAGLWNWILSDDKTPVLYFGVPLWNFMAWFACVFAFSLTVRWFWLKQEKAVRLYKGQIITLVGPYRRPSFTTQGWEMAKAAVKTLTVAVVFATLLTKCVKCLMDSSGDDGWQYLIIVILAAAAFLTLLVELRNIRTDDPEPRVDARVVFLYYYLCGAVALVSLGIREREIPDLTPVWAASAVVVTAFLLAAHWNAPKVQTQAPLWKLAEGDEG